MPATQAIAQALPGTVIRHVRAHTAPKRGKCSHQLERTNLAGLKVEGQFN